ncbi:MAG: methyltransferase domain-containing protein [Anaerolineales bacterium]
MKPDKQYSPWRLNWTPEHVERFWDWWGSNPALLKHYFSRRNGEAILDQVQRYARFTGTVVDLGAGPGYIVDLLVRRGVKTLAVDTSSDSLDALEQRMKGSGDFLGTRVSQADKVPVDDQEADAVLLIETIEHLDDDILEGILNETYRIIKPGGWLAVTTPNDENLAELETICPHCGCIYHTYQHVRSWHPNVLKEYMAKIGFDRVVCKPTLFSFLPTLLRPFHRLAYTVLGVKLPHLLYIGRKPKSS